jgi:hypothetical protein
MPDFGIFRGFNDKLFGDKLYAGQLPINLGLIGSTDFSGTDPDAQSFFDRVTAAGGALSLTERTAVNTLVKQMKADGIWIKMKAVYPMVGASGAACAQNLKSSSFTGRFFGGVSFTYEGLITNGSNAAMSTDLVPATHLTLYSNHISLYNNLGGNKSYVFSTYDDTRGGIALTIQGLTNYNGLNCGTSTSSTESNSLGFYTNSRTANNSTAIYKNATLSNSNTATASALQPSGGLVIGATSYNTTNNPSFGYSSLKCSFASIGDGLTNQNAQDLYNSVQAFNTTLSRQV